jgi:hypothetical protein
MFSFPNFKGGVIFVAKNQLQCSNENLISYYANGFNMAGYLAGFPAI